MTLRVIGGRLKRGLFVRRRGRRRILGSDSGPNLGNIPIFDSFSEHDHDHLIWCAGFRSVLGLFRHLMRGRETAVKNLHRVGYGNWNGEGSATLMRVGSFVKHTAQVVAGCVDETRQHSEWMSAVSRPLNYSSCGTKRVSQ